MGQPVAWFEVTGSDAARAQKFYADLFGWRISADPTMGGYGIVDTGAGESAIGGGIGGLSGPDDKPGVRIYMRVDDLDAYLDKAERLGGTRLVAPTKLPGDFGSFAVFADPDGNQVGLWG